MKKEFLVAALAWAFTAGAQTDSSTALTEVVVTANRTLQKQNSTGKVVTVIDSMQLARSGGLTLAQLLNRQAGLTIIGAQNNPGTNQDVFMQGAASGKTLILINGIPAYDPSTISTAFDINHLPVENIERIEIVRGALSTLYGSDAVAGVINIITKKGGAKKATPYLTFAGGSFETFKTVAGVNGTLAKANYNLQYSRLQSRGFSAAYDSTKRGNFDRDRFAQNIFSGNLKRQLSKQLSLSVDGSTAWYKTELDANRFADEKDYTFSSRNNRLTVSAVYTWRKNRLQASYNFNHTDRKFLDDSAFVGGFAKYSRERYEGRSQVAELFANIGLNKKAELVVGADQRWQNTDQLFFSVSSFGPFKDERGADSTRMQQSSLFATALLKNIGGLNIEVGGRYNHHNVYGDNSTYSINPSYRLGSFKVFSNIGSAFKAPSLYQLFVVNEGRKALQAEQSRNIDAGIAYEKPGLLARVLCFSRRIENGIEYNYSSFDYFNNNLQKDRGLEAEMQVRKKLWNVIANYTHVDGEVNTVNFVYNPNTFSYEDKGDTTFNNIFRRPANAVNITFGINPFSAFYLSAHARFAGKRLEPIFGDKPVVLDAYQTLDVYAEYNVNAHWKFFADARNITNTKFFDVWGYSTARANVLAGVQWRL